MFCIVLNPRFSKEVPEGQVQLKTVPYSLEDPVAASQSQAGYTAGGGVTADEGAVVACMESSRVATGEGTGVPFSWDVTGTETVDGTGAETGVGTGAETGEGTGDETGEDTVEATGEVTKVTTVVDKEAVVPPVVLSSPFPFPFPWPWPWFRFLLTNLFETRDGTEISSLCICLCMPCARLSLLIILFLLSAPRLRLRNCLIQGSSSHGPA